MISPEVLEDCPSDDRLWMTVVRQARRQPALESLLVRIRSVGDSHAKRWEPAWAEGQVLMRLRINDSMAAARTALLRGLELASAQGDSMGISRGETAMAVWYRKSGDLESSARSADRGRAAAELARRTDLIGAASNALAGARMRAGRYAEALQATNRALTAYSQIGDGARVRISAYNRALILKSLGNLAEARTALEDVHRTAAEVGDSTMTAMARIALGNLSRALEDWGAAGKWFGAVATAGGRFAVFAEMGLGRVALATRDLEQALPHDRSAVGISEVIDDLR